MSRMTKLILRTDAIRMRAIERLVMLKLEPMLMEMVLRPYKAKRSDMQNRRLHKIIRMCAEHAGYSVAEMKLTFKEELLEPLEIVEIKDYRIPEFKSTSDMAVGELTSFMEGVEDLAALWYEITLPAQDWRDAR